MRKLLAVLTAMFAASTLYAQGQPVGEDESKVSRRYEYEVNMMKDPVLGYVPLSKLAAAKEYRANRIAQINGVQAAPLLTWTERGPDRDATGPSTGNPRPGNGVTSGRIRGMWEDLGDPSGKTVWVGSASGGLWKTNNITANPAGWILVNDYLDNLAISSICQDPSNINIMYFGTGEKTFNADAVRGAGIWRSTDHGATWALMPGTANFWNVGKLSCDANGNLYVACIAASASQGLQRYTKGTGTWTNITPAGLSARVPDLELSSKGRLHVSCGYYSNPANSGYRFTDNPATVTSASWSSPATTFPTQSNVDLATKGDTLFALSAILSTGPNPALEVPVIYKSLDGGVNWAATNTSPVFTSGQAWYCLGIAIDPNDGDNVIVGSLDCYKTTNGGNSWNKISNWVGTTGQYVHADQQIITWRSNNQVLIGSDGGVHYSADGGSTISDRNRGLRIKQFYSVSSHPTSPDYFLAGAQDNGGHQLTTAGIGASVEVKGGDGGFFHIDQNQAQFQWGAYTQSDYYRSIDGGATWQDVRYPANLSLPTVGRFINPSDYDDLNRIMYCGGAPDTYLRWDNAHNSANFSVVPMSMGTGDVSAVKVSPYTNNTVFFGGGGNSISPSLIRATNANAASPSFAVISGGLPATAGSNISCIELGKKDSNIIVTYSNYGINNIWVTSDAGTNWTAIDGDLPDMPVRWAMFYPGSNTRAIIGTEAGIWQTDNISGSATNWSPETGFPNVRTNMLQYRRSDRLLTAATHGRGLFTTTLKPDSVIGLTAGPVTNSKATLRWNKAGDALNYSVDYKLNSTGTWISAGTALTDTFTVLTGLKDGVTYDWRVRANWGPGTSSNYSPAQFSTIQFAVTAPNTNVSFIAGKTISVTWSGSTAALSPNVKISLSTDGGVSYTRTLAASAPNNNTAQVILPKLATMLARVKIESIDTIPFFDVSDTNFIITPEPVECSKLDVQVYKRDTSFSTITSDDNGNVYLGTQTKGLYRYENGVVKNYTYGLNALLSWRRTWMRQMTVVNNQLWVAHSGFIFNNLGDVDYYRYGGAERINILNGPGSRQNFRGQRVVNVDLTIAGPNTRNTMGIFADTTGRIWSISDYADSVAYPELYNYNARYWYKTGGVGIMAPGQGNFFRNETSFPNPAGITPGVGTPGLESNSIGKRKGCAAITAVGNEVLVTSRGYTAVGDTLFTAGILRYNRSTGAYIGKYDQNNTGLPFGLTNTSDAAPAIYTDMKNRVWLAFGGGRLAVMDTSGWHYIGTPTWLGNGGSIQPNAISGDRKGIIYIGTDAGLLVFNNNMDTSGVGSYTKDSSYCLYTTANNLSSNYIRATHVDRSGNIWLGTGSGVCKIQKGDLLMYNLKAQPGGNYVTNDEGKRLVVAGFDPGIENSDTIRVAADGTSATLFKWQGKDPAKLKPLIKEGTAQADFGKITVVNRSPDSLVLQYRHPDYLSEPFLSQGSRTVTLQLFDTTQAPAKLIIEVKLVVVQPPVLCLHGIWSSGETFSKMTQYLTDSAGYKNYMVSAPDYANDVYFINNQYVARDEANKLLVQCADNNFSAGKVDIIAHSMGGILSRIYLQNTAFNQTYHKLITINTPHSGSQIADLVRTSPALSLIVNGILGNNTDNGALEDLRVTKDGIRVLLNGPANLNRNKVPVHAISSDYTDLQVYELLVNITLTVASYVPALGRVTAVAKRMLAIIKYAAYSGTTCNTSESVHDCLKNKIFEDDNDIAVAKTSQQAGLPVSAVSFFNNISHNNILDRTETFNRLKALLKNKTTDGAFTSNGYNPATLDYNASITAPAGITAETVTINSPVSGASYPAGQTISVDIAGSANVKKILLASGNATLGIGYYNTATQNYTFNYPIPKEAIGRLFFVAVGYDELGRPTMDSAVINVGPPVGVTLDSIRIENRRKLKVYKGDSLWLKITGYYSDTVRDISNLAGITYVVDDVNVKMSNVLPNYVIGQVVGYDNFRATLQGKSDTGYIEILEKPVGPGGGGVIPVVLTSFTGRLVGNAVQLKWNTAQEINASHFDVERSEDGSRFVKIGRVQARGNTSTGSDYNFDDPLFKTGANYYRLRLVDADGRFTYSVVVLIRVSKDKQQEILIFPNPAGKYVNVNVTEGLHPQWTMRLYNIVGQQLVTHTIPANQNNERVQLPSLAPGIYTVTISAAGGEKIYNSKLVIQQ
jgi:pimeloyl-ACP methyl ester carboxylesterase